MIHAPCPPDSARETAVHAVPLFPASGRVIIHVPPAAPGRAIIHAPLTAARERDPIRPLSACGVPSQPSRPRSTRRTHALAAASARARPRTQTSVRPREHIRASAPTQRQKNTSACPPPLNVKGNTSARPPPLNVKRTRLRVRPQSTSKGTHPRVRPHFNVKRTRPRVRLHSTSKGTRPPRPRIRRQTPSTRLAEPPHAQPAHAAHRRGRRPQPDSRDAGRRPVASSTRLAGARLARGNPGPRASPLDPRPAGHEGRPPRHADRRASRHHGSRTSGGARKADLETRISYIKSETCVSSRPKDTVGTPGQRGQFPARSNHVGTQDRCERASCTSPSNAKRRVLAECPSRQHELCDVEESAASKLKTRLHLCKRDPSTKERTQNRKGLQNQVIPYLDELVHERDLLQGKF
jgi:hypothetical protein